MYFELLSNTLSADDGPVKNYSESQQLYGSVKNYSKSQQLYIYNSRIF
jgi:hypothetical protein